MANVKLSDLIANGDTNLAAAAVGDYILIYDISEPLDINKIKVITTANFLKLATESQRQALVTGQAAGDLFYASSPTALTRLGIGNNGKTLSVSPGGVPAWGGLACAKLYLGTPVSINNLTDYIIQFTQEAIDDYGYADISSQPTRITVPPGVYLVFGHIEWASSTQYDVKILIDGGLYFVNSFTNKSDNFIYLKNVTENRYFEIQIKHAYGSSLNLNDAEFDVIKIG